MGFRRRLALFICPELAASTRVNCVTSRDQLLVKLADLYAEATSTSDWEIAARAGVNNRALILLRDGKTVRPKTAAALFELFRSSRAKMPCWPVSPEDERRFFRVDCIPAVEKVGGAHAVHSLVVASGRSRTLDAVYSWTRRGLPCYARRLISQFARENGVALGDEDFEVAKLTALEIQRLKAAAPSTAKSDTKRGAA